MTPDAAVAELEAELRREPRNLGVRLRLAAALREAGRGADAVNHYHALARSYRSAGDLRQAMAACHSALSIDPEHAEMRILLAQLQAEGSRAESGADARPPGVPSSSPNIQALASKLQDVPEAGRSTLKRPPPVDIDATDPDFERVDDAVVDDGVIEDHMDTAPSAQHPVAELLDDDLDDVVDTAPSAEHPAAALAAAAEAESRAGEDDEDEDGVTSPSVDLPVVEITAQLPEYFDGGVIDENTAGAARVNPVTQVRGSPESTDAAASDAGLELARAFDRPFSEALDRMRGGEEPTSPAAAFPGLPDAALAELSKGIERTRLGRGEIMLREGEPGDACYVLIRGEVRILKRDPVNPRGDLVEVTRLRDGELFGEFALLADRRRHATVQTVTDCELFVVPRRLLRRLASRYSEVGPQLERFYRKRLLQTLMATAPFFSPLKPVRRQELMSRFNPRKVDSGDEIIKEGDRAGGFYLIVLGSVEITKRVGKHQTVLLASLGEAAYFGEMSLLRGDVARASVRATGPVELAVLSPKDFYDVVADNPVLWDQVRRVAHERELETYEIVAGVTGSV